MVLCICIFLVIIASISEGIRRASEDHYSKQHMDKDGTYRLSTGEIKDSITGGVGYEIISSYSGDRMLVRKDHSLIRNISAGERAIYYDKIKDNPHCTVSLYMKCCATPHVLGADKESNGMASWNIKCYMQNEPVVWKKDTWKCFPEGDLFEDKKTGKRYVARNLIACGKGSSLNPCAFLDITNGQYVRLTDKTEQYCKLGELDRNELISIMNERNKKQREYVREYNNLTEYEKYKGKDIELLNKVYENNQVERYYDVMLDPELEKFIK